VAVVGRNGAGKSTMLRLFNGLLRPGEGRITLDGKDAAGMSVAAISAHVGTVFQAPEQQIFNATVRSEIGFGPARQGRTGEALEACILASAERAGIADQLDRHPLDLDQATRRFVALASVLAMEPRVLLLDEAQRGLDRLRRQQLLAIIAEERQKDNAVILVCHDMEFAAAVADRVVGLAGGGVAVDRPAAAFFDDAAATHAVSVEQPPVTAMAQALGLDPVMTPAALADLLRARHMKGTGTCG